MTTRNPAKGQTPIDPDEATGLLLHVRTQEALNRAEEANIVQALVWARRSRIVRQRLLTDEALRRIHGRMFGAVWSWAGRYRLTDKNIGLPCHGVPEAVRLLCDNFAFRAQLATEKPDRLAVDFHHQLVSIHAFPNGNGRHSRFCADRLVENLGGAAFAWGRVNLQVRGEARERYLTALREADAGDPAALVSFARSDR